MASFAGTSKRLYYSEEEAKIPTREMDSYYSGTETELVLEIAS